MARAHVWATGVADVGCWQWLSDGLCGAEASSDRKPLVVLLARRHDVAVEDAMQQVMNQMRKYSMIQARRRGRTHPPESPALRQGDAAPPLQARLC